MHKRIAFIVGVILVVSVLVILGIGRMQTANAACQFQMKSLLGASQGDVTQAALEYSCASFQEFGNSPQVLLSRSTTPEEVISIFGRTDGFCQTQRLALVILKGDFAISDYGLLLDLAPTSSNPPRFQYLGLVMDLKSGMPTMVDGSHGEKLRTVLNDPSLPSDFLSINQTPNPRFTPMPSLPTRPMQPCSNSNGYVPTLMPPPP